MAEQWMETTVRTALWQQFSAAIDRLENALLACPETLWQEHLWIDVESTNDGTFWDITFHTLGCLDLFLTGCSEEALPAFKKRSDGVIPKDELHPYLVQLRQKCQTTFAALSDEKAHQPYTFPWPGGATVSYFELFLYTLRHVQEHAAQLSLFLGQHAIPSQARRSTGFSMRRRKQASFSADFPMCTSLSVFAQFECTPESAHHMTGC